MARRRASPLAIAELYDKRERKIRMETSSALSFACKSLLHNTGSAVRLRLMVSFLLYPLRSIP